MMKKIRHLFQRSATAVVLATILFLSQIGFPAVAHAQPQTSPFVESESADYPNGSQWATAEYEQISGSVTLQGRTFGAMSESEIGFGAAALVQSQLPGGFTLQRGTTSHIVVGGSSTAKNLNAREREKLSAADSTEVIDPEQAEQLKLDDRGQKPSKDKWFVRNGVEYQGIPLAKFSDVLTIVGANGEAQYVRQRNLPLKVDATSSTVTSEQAVELAKQDAGIELAADEAKLEIWVDPELNGHLTWTLTLKSPSLTDPKALRYWVAAVGEPKILYRENQIFHTHQGRATGTLWSASPLQGTENRPLGDLRVMRSDGATQVTNKYGLYGFTTGSGTATIQTTLSGPNSVVQNQAGSTLNRNKDGTPDNPIPLNFGASTDEELAQVTAFYWTNVARNLARTGFDPNLPDLPTNVNIAGLCNAFWNGSSINFYRAGGGCPNTAYADVVLHEYGHGVDARQGGILDGGYSEGFGDALAILGTRQSCLGRDFFGAGTCLRPATDVILWPPAPGDGVHAIGRRYAGFTWELIQQLKNTYSEDGAYQIAADLVLAAAAANPANVPDAVRLSFIADDDDGNLSNGTPHFAELAAAADSRNIPRPAGLVRDRVGYVWANDPAAASYTPSATYSYNSAGGAMTITRSGTGRYSVRFAGLGGGSSSGGNVQVTSYGFGSESCKVQSWGSGGSDFVANVGCFTANGSPGDSRYTVLVTWH